MTAQAPDHAQWRLLQALNRVTAMLAELGPEIERPDVSVSRRGQVAIAVVQPHNDPERRFAAVRRIAAALGSTANPQQTNTAYMVSGDGVIVHTTRVERCKECGRAKQ